MRRRALLAGISSAAFTAATARAQSALGVGAPALPGPPAPKQDDIVAPGFQRLVIARWGDGVLPNAPPFDPDPLTGLEADTQFPYDAVIAALIAPPPAEDGVARLVLVTANPSAPARMVFPPDADAPQIAGRLQGVTVMNLQWLGGRWVTVDGGYQSRRLSDGTLCQISGPCAAAIGGTVQGVLAVNAGCPTPWGRVLLAEGDAGPWLARLAKAGTGHDDPATAALFSWVTEFDPLDPGDIPIKRTALGRIARAGIAAGQTADKRAVVFFTEDDPAGHLFRFIAAGNATDGAALDSGTLAVARVKGSGIDWLPLGTDVSVLTGLAGAAADAGASPFDAPGGLALATDGGALYLACAGNPARDTPDIDALNPRAGDDNGHVIAFSIPDHNLAAENFPATLAIVAGDPASAPLTRYAPGSTSWLRRPRTLDLDDQGRLWIGTDANGDAATADGLFVMAPGFSVASAYFAPIGAAIGGAAFDPAHGTVFASVRHPGATAAASFNYPATRWPIFRPDMPPQTTIIGLVRA